jgi:DNA (cytosine-5)-methyltransferase 1
MKDDLKMIDLFAGTGAFSYIFEKQKIKCVFANDMCNESEEIFNLNHKNIKLTNKDLNKINVENIPKHDILCGGFPCQPFSIAGKQKGFNDKRANVFNKIIDILNFHKPNIIILENVKNLISHDKGNTFKIILNKLKKSGYYVKYKILNTCKLTNIPQNRERIYIVGFRNKKQYTNFEFNFKEIKNKPIKSFLEKNIDQKFYYTDKSKIYDKLKKDISQNVKNNVVYQYRRYYVRENKNNLCPTLTANMGTGGHNVPIILDDKGIRKLTPKECFNFQGFPNNYKLPELSNGKLYKLSGNAVSVPIIELIINNIIKILN